MPSALQSAAKSIVGLLVVVLAIWLGVHSAQVPTPVGQPPVPAPSGSAVAARDDAKPSTSAGATADDAGTLLLSDLVAAESDRHFEGGVGGAMADGAPVPPLPANAPREVRFGVVLVSYSGAQPSAGGGHPSSRSRVDAKALATKLLATAQQDFHAAVQEGDAGSSEDVGRVKLGILEPAPEYVLFTLPAGGVAGPIDTPRGYWIVKRLD